MGIGIDNSPSWLSRIVFGRNPKRTAVLLKRVIGLPGETIAVEQGIVRINGEPLEELYVKNQKAPWQIPEQTLANDEYYVIGDNREMRESNHDHGPVNERDIVGKVLF